MKKNHLVQLALLGITTGVVVPQQTVAAPITSTKSSAPSSSSSQSSDANSENEGYHLMSEQELKSYLNTKGRALFESLSPEGKALALRVASARCNGTNECSGLNACKTDINDCAGKGSCKGTGKCSIADKNLAVKLSAKKMAEKRAKLNPR